MAQFATQETQRRMALSRELARGCWYGNVVGLFATPSSVGLCPSQYSTGATWYAIARSKWL